MQNKIFIFAGAIIIVGAIFLGVRHSSNLKTISPISDMASTTSTSTKPIISTNETRTESSNTIKKSAWNVFQNYLGFLKVHNLAGFKSVAYQISDTCNDSSKTKECNTLMDGAFDIGKEFKESDFTHVRFDSKQIVLSTEFTPNQSDVARSLIRQVVYFARSADGTPKVLSFTTPYEVTYTIWDKNKHEATSTVDAKLQTRVTDTDADEMPDEVETCSFQGANPDCIKTNPNKKDSKGDGWWDGVRVFVRMPKTY